MTKAKSSNTSPQSTAVQRDLMNLAEFTGVLFFEQHDLAFKNLLLAGCVSEKSAGTNVGSSGAGKP